MKKINIAAALLFSTAMMIGAAGVSRAASYDDPVTSIALSIEYELSSSMTASDIDVSSDTDGIDSVTVSSVTNTSYGKRPTVTLKIKADTSSGYYFDSEDAAELKTEEAFSISGDETEYRSSKRTSNSAVTLVLRLPKIGSTEDGGLDVEEVTWVDDTGVAEWTEAEDANKYSVKLLRGSSTKSTVTTTNTYYDFSSLIRQYGTGSYTVKVKAYNGSYGGEEWTESSEFDVDSDNLSNVNGGSFYNGTSYGGTSYGSPYYSSGNPTNAASSGSTPSATSSAASVGAWLRDAVGWWYCNADRSYTSSDWQQINGLWYYFDEKGYMVTGWFQSPVSGYWYYLDPENGSMATNRWIGSYYVNADGIWVQ